MKKKSDAFRIKAFLTIKEGISVEPGSYPVRLRELYECDHDLFRFIEQTAIRPETQRGTMGRISADGCSRSWYTVWFACTILLPVSRASPALRFRS